MTAFAKEGKTSSLKQNSGRKQKLSDRDRQTLTQIVWKDHKNTALKITAELNDYFENPVSSKTVWEPQSSKKPYYNKFPGVSIILSNPTMFMNKYIHMYRNTCIYPTPPHEQDATQGQFVSVFNRCEYLLDETMTHGAMDRSVWFKRF